MRRPSFGKRILTGLLLMAKRTHINMQNGFMPHTWTLHDREDVRRAIRYISDFYDWSMAQQEERTAAEQKQKETMESVEAGNEVW